MAMLSILVIIVNNYLYVPFTCKSRFCCSCGTKYTLDRADTIARKSINCPHRHITFTIHHDLWPLFQKDRSLLNLLFDAVSSTILSWFFEQNHKENFTPGFISTLHTFGRDLKWNPHIHVLITEGAAGNFSPWKKFEVFPYTMLRNRFQTTLLSLLENHFGKQRFKSLKKHIYRTSKNGFYVHAPKIKARDIKSTVKYVFAILVNLLWLNLVSLIMMANLLPSGMKDTKTTKELKKLFMLMILLKDLLFISMINILMLLDIMVFMLKIINSLINLFTCLSPMSLNLKNS